uniref:Uncharacterized protein n=1 Tax=Arundo donax TaxID=35708 RepID=A0A0A9HQ93_ARUDO
MAGCSWHDQILQAQHLGLLPDVPPPVAVGGRLLEEGHPEEHGELARRWAPGVGLHRPDVVERRLTAVPCLPKSQSEQRKSPRPRARHGNNGPGGAWAWQEQTLLAPCTWRSQGRQSMAASVRQ